MPQKTNLNVNPYFDDFNANNQYYRILFKPSVPVQARELTQLQSMLQHQIESLAGLNLQNGDIVSGCSINDIPYLPYVNLSDFQSNGAPYTLSSLVNTQVISLSTNLASRVLTTTSGQQSNYPNTNVIYVQPLGSGSNSTSNQVMNYTNTDQLVFYRLPRTGNNVADTVAVINTYPSNTTTTMCGNAHGITISEGVVFLSGCLVQVLNPTIGIVNATGTYASNLVVGFVATESIVNSNQDPSLLDNALGYGNENAPGADRLKIQPGLVALSPTVAANTPGFNPVATYNFGSLVTTAVAGSNLYSIVGDAIAQRIYDEAGNYVVNPFSVDTVTSVPGNTIIATLGANNILGRISPGVGYASGQRIELQKTNYIQMRRGIDTQVVSSQQITFNYGSYFVLSEVAGGFPFANAATVALYNTPQMAVTNRTFTTTAPSGSIIGTANMRCFTYSAGTIGSNTAQYLLHVYNIKMSNGFNVNQIQSVYSNGSILGVGDVISAGIVGAASDDQLYSFGVTGIKALRDSSNNNSSQYTYRTVNTATMAVGGNIVVTIASSAPGGVDQIPFGNGILPDFDAEMFNVVLVANSVTANLSGTITTTGANVAGSSTTFLTDFNVGDVITASATNRIIQTIANNTFMTVDTAFGSNLAANTYIKTNLAGKHLQIAQNVIGKTSFVNVTNSTSFTIVTNQAPTAPVSVYVTYDVLRTTVSPAQKIINKNRFVCINVANSAGGPNGPFCLGLPDVHRVQKVYGTSGGGFTTSGTDITSQFSWDTGQTDTNYGLAYLYPKSAVTSNNLLVLLDYFSSNTASGLGFYTVESYPIDDSNTANVNAVQTSTIPVYMDEQGNKIYLRDYVDFRTPCVATANDTGFVNLANSAAVTAAITAATINPSSNLAFSIPATGLNNPSFGRNFQATYTMYLPRKDLVMITPDNIVTVKEGLSKINPQTPLYPDNIMVVSVLNIPPFPSLTTDQSDALLAVNQSCRTLVRDTSTAISSSLVTNRRYTMRDIGVLDSRITNLEYYEQLSLLQTAATAMNVTDQNGLNRFKNGIFVDPFSDFTNCDVSNPEFSVAIDQTLGIARPKIQREVFRIKFNAGASPNVQQTGRVITLPYAEIPFMSQPYATKYRAAALTAFAWNGTIILFPNYDNYNDIINTGSINVTVDNTTAWKDFANTPFASIWGDWVTTTNSVSSSVITGQQNIITQYNNVYVTNTVYNYVNTVSYGYPTVPYSGSFGG
ncbi:MAG: DUF4815 domain-containing protein [Candidatus Bathyarchaeia archaeon]